MLNSKIDWNENLEDCYQKEAIAWLSIIFPHSTLQMIKATVCSYCILLHTWIFTYGLYQDNGKAFPCNCTFCPTVEVSFCVLQLVRTRLEHVSPEEKVVESLIPMWQEEKLRCEGNLPEGPPSPPRTPEPLCKTVEDLRAQYQVSFPCQLLKENQDKLFR